jgi:hypothetical protein
MRLRAAAVALVVLGVTAPARAESPEILYMLQCRGCHRPDGAGTPGVVPPLAGFVGRFLGVPGGREFLVRVPGSAQSPLTDRVRRPPLVDVGSVRRDLVAAIEATR